MLQAAQPRCCVAQNTSRKCKTSGPFYTEATLFVGWTSSWLSRPVVLTQTRRDNKLDKTFAIPRTRTYSIQTIAAALLHVGSAALCKSTGLCTSAKSHMRQRLRQKRHMESEAVLESDLHVFFWVLCQRH
jgi:hypothetical protein